MTFKSSSLTCVSPFNNLEVNLDIHQHCMQVANQLESRFGWRLAPYMEELHCDHDLVEVIEHAVAPVDFFHTKSWASALDLGVFRATLYALIRSTRPKLAIETGVLHGLTSLFMLRGLRKNGHGKLISIDLPSPFGNPPANKDGCVDTLPPDLGSGWIVDNSHAACWDLQLGPSLELLPVLLDEPVDLFLHDSDHSYDVMAGELAIAWNNARPGAVIICDNIDLSDAFYDFCAGNELVPALISEQFNGDPRFGIVKKHDC